MASPYPAQMRPQNNPFLPARGRLPANYPPTASAHRRASRSTSRHRWHRAPTPSPSPSPSPDASAGPRPRRRMAHLALEAQRAALRADYAPARWHHPQHALPAYGDHHLDAACSASTHGHANAAQPVSGSGTAAAPAPCNSQDPPPDYVLVDRVAMMGDGAAAFAAQRSTPPWWWTQRRFNGQYGHESVTSERVQLRGTALRRVRSIQHVPWYHFWTPCSAAAPSEEDTVDEEWAAARRLPTYAEVVRGGAASGSPAEKG